jgi:hypothetical protein
MNQQPPLRWFRFSLRTLFVVVTVACLCSPLVVSFFGGVRGSDSSRNELALCACRLYIEHVEAWAKDHDGQEYSYDASDSNEWLPRLMKCGGLVGIVFVARDPFRVDSAGPKKIILVWDRAYNDFPRRRSIWKAPYAHAVAYSRAEPALSVQTSSQNSTGAVSHSLPNLTRQKPVSTPSNTQSTHP